MPSVDKNVSTEENALWWIPIWLSALELYSPNQTAALTVALLLFHVAGWFGEVMIPVQGGFQVWHFTHTYLQ